ncbi:hypothetical protein GCK72_003798 [Caenorhabditis remanei]|uniref:Uncharacterized protein n=1 Tax=Caenorhabditis remanei TaxID=31234 RepID=A0A6A5HBS4_CAERE|nr:hypothetical protein GCK72_003798 [Caenorhabditis remanei]KAF1763852.1 hypothetical protein GCK72_003798 [Caenorhabditis remanei]
MDNNDFLRDSLEYEKGKSEVLSERVATAHHLKNIAIREGKEKKNKNELMKVEKDQVKERLDKTHLKQLKNNEMVLKEQRISVIFKMKKEERKRNRYKTCLSRVIPPYDGLASRKGQYNRIEKAFSYLQYLGG